LRKICIGQKYFSKIKYVWFLWGRIYVLEKRNKGHHGQKKSRGKQLCTCPFLNKDFPCFLEYSREQPASKVNDRSFIFNVFRAPSSKVVGSSRKRIMFWETQKYEPFFTITSLLSSLFYKAKKKLRVSTISLNFRDCTSTSSLQK
jgi:hypothetical protein